MRSKLTRKQLIEIAQKEHQEVLSEQAPGPSPSQQALQAIEPAIEQVQALLSPEGSIQNAQIAAQGDLEALGGVGQTAAAIQEPLAAITQMAQDPNLSMAAQAAMQQLQALIQDALPMAQDEAGNDLEALGAVGQEAGAVQQAIGQAMDTIQQQDVALRKAEEKAAKEQKRQETQAGLGEGLTRVLEDSYKIEEAFRSSNVSRVYQVEAKMVSERNMNIKDLFNSIRAIEGVTVVSTEAESVAISDTLQKNIISLKFLKGPHSVKHYLQLLATAIKRLGGVKSFALGKVDMLRDV